MLPVTQMEELHMHITDTQETGAFPSMINTSTFELTQEDVEFSLYILIMLP